MAAEPAAGGPRWLPAGTVLLVVALLGALAGGWLLTRQPVLTPIDLPSVARG